MRIAIIYWSGTGNTEAMASLIAQGVRSTGAEADVLPIHQCDKDVVDRYDRFAFGCPASAQEELEDMEFLPVYEDLEPLLAGKRVALFGSYGWGDGQWMRDWSSRTTSTGARLFEEGLMAHETPDSESIATCHNFGARFATF